MVAGCYLLYDRFFRLHRKSYDPVHRSLDIVKHFPHIRVLFDLGDYVSKPFRSCRPQPFDALDTRYRLLHTQTNPLFDLRRRCSKIRNGNSYHIDGHIRKHLDLSRLKTEKPPRHYQQHQKIRRYMVTCKPGQEPINFFSFFIHCQTPTHHLP